jgi:hypothetical protein
MHPNNMDRIGMVYYFIGGDPPTGIYIAWTSNFGATWEQPHTLVTTSTSNVRGIQYDRTDSNIIYVTGKGLWRSTDGGKSWKGINFGIV